MLLFKRKWGKFVPAVIGLKLQKAFFYYYIFIIKKGYALLKNEILFEHWSGWMLLWDKMIKFYTAASLMGNWTPRSNNTYKDKQSFYWRSQLKLIYYIKNISYLNAVHKLCPFFLSDIYKLHSELFLQECKL